MDLFTIVSSFLAILSSFLYKIFRNVAELNGERIKELRAFDKTKLGVKGLVDAGIVNFPKIFVRPAEELEEEMLHNRKSHNVGIPVIDLDCLFADDRREKIVDEIRIASETWGFFQVVNHGIPIGVLGNMLEGVRKFHEGDIDVKKGLYKRDPRVRVYLNSNYDLFKSKTVNWRYTVYVSMFTPDDFDPNQLPASCRTEVTEYVNHMSGLGKKLFELLSEALGLKQEHLVRTMHCDESRLLGGHYYPECPEPDLAIGIAKDTDPSFLTILAQDQTGGLQVLHENQWFDVHPIPGALVVNIGDLLPVVSNGKFKSNVHRVIPRRERRMSTAILFGGRFTGQYGPIKELISDQDQNPPKYRQVIMREHLAKIYNKGLHEKPGPNDYRL